MAVNPVKIRLGACDSMVMFQTVDLGASTGGAELNYNPTTLPVEIDQIIMPVVAFRTKEELTFDVAIVQVQMSLVSVAFGYGSGSVLNVTTVATGTLGTSPTPTLSTIGAAGSTSYSYQVVPFTSNGDGVPVAATTISTGNATLTPTNAIQIAWTGIVGAVGYKLIRTASGGSPSSTGLIGTVWAPTGASALTFLDTGLAATAYSPSATAPTIPNTDTSSFGGQVVVYTGPFDAGIPKNDGTSNHLRLHLQKVFSAKAIKLDAKRDKASELNKLSLMALADTTQVQGGYAGFLREEY